MFRAVAGLSRRNITQRVAQQCAPRSVNSSLMSTTMTTRRQIRCISISSSAGNVSKTVDNTYTHPVSQSRRYFAAFDAPESPLRLQRNIGVIAHIDAGKCLLL